MQQAAKKVSLANTLDKPQKLKTFPQDNSKYKYLLDFFFFPFIKSAQITVAFANDIQNSLNHSAQSFREGDVRNALRGVFDLFVGQETTFLRIIFLSTFLAILSYPYPSVAMWVGFCLAGYSAIANDSIQTVGTFIASNSHRKWWQLWLFMGVIFVGTVAVSWFINDGDVTYQRLASKGFSDTPLKYEFLQIAAPIVLLILTRLKMPVSTTFLLLSAFSANFSGIWKVTQKSLSGYLIAFAAALMVWFAFDRYVRKLLQGEAAKYWVAIQWVVSGILWSVWVMQDAANIAIFLPRSLDTTQFLVFSGYIFFGLGILFYLRGDKIQEVVTKKTEVSDVRSATLIDFVYALVLIFFQKMSSIPMSTTWVFLGLLGGREIAIRLRSSDKSKAAFKRTFGVVGLDLGSALIGLAVSILLAMGANPVTRQEILNFFNL